MQRSELFIYLFRFFLWYIRFFAFRSGHFSLSFFVIICMQGDKSKRLHFWIYFWVIITRLWTKSEIKITLIKKNSFVFASEDDIPLSYNDKARLTSPLMFLNKYFKICRLVGIIIIIAFTIASNRWPKQLHAKILFTFRPILPRKYSFTCICFCYK